LMFKRVVQVALVFAILADTVAAIAQSPLSFEFGMRAGVPLMKNLRPSGSGSAGFIAVSTSEKPAYTAGPTIGATFYDRVSVRVDALYKPVASTVEFRSTSSMVQASTINRGSSWEFPLLVNYRFGRGSIRPYGGVGIVIGEFVSIVNEFRSRN